MRVIKQLQPSATTRGQSTSNWQEECLFSRNLPTWCVVRATQRCLPRVLRGLAKRLQLAGAGPSVMTAQNSTGTLRQGHQPIPKLPLLASGRPSEGLRILQLRDDRKVTVPTAAQAVTSAV